jgi:hypothetical protein
MLSVYYGTKLQPYIYDNTFIEIDHYLHKKEIPRTIEKLKKKVSHLLWIDYRVTDKEIFICDVRDAEVLDIGHVVKVLEKEGKVIGRTYDVTNNIMYYFTDIVMETVENESLTREFEDKTEKVISNLEKIYQQYLNETNVKDKKKSLLKRIFG